MDWARDHACLSSESDLGCFKYDARPAVVIKIVQSNAFEAQKWCLENEGDWATWLNTHIDSRDSGFVLILAGQTETKAITKQVCHQSPISSSLKDLNGEMPFKMGIRRRETLAGLGDKKLLEIRPLPTPAQMTRQKRGLRHLPFRESTFREICKAMQVHRSIIRAITRSDIPSFGCERVTMIRPSLVYNCRTSNAWPSDAALSVTHYPKSGMSFAILYGSNVLFEQSIMERLRHVTTEAMHPLLLPGMFVELELERHKSLVEASINEVEARIIELDIKAGDKQNYSRDEVEKKNEAKRTAWLDMTYLRNSITTWKVQIERMSEHIQELDRDDIVYQDYENRPNTTRLMTGVSMKIKRRLNAICDEYDEQIRDCTMRVDGMAMATQWAHSETAVEIAMATNQDAKVMRSISLVTMIFLPGTFFATVFSMTFFDWNDNKGDARVSGYLWIYVVVTVVFTAITIGLWYFFVVYRKPNKVQLDEEIASQYKESSTKYRSEKHVRPVRLAAQVRNMLRR